MLSNVRRESWSLASFRLLFLGPLTLLVPPRCLVRHVQEAVDGCLVPFEGLKPPGHAQFVSQEKYQALRETSLDSILRKTVGK